MKQCFYFLMLCAYALATIGGFGYSAYCGAWHIAVSIIALAVMAFPTAKKYFKKLTSEC